MQPVDVQNREDQLLGAAWRRCEAALPDGGWLDGVSRGLYDASFPFTATAMIGTPTMIDIFAEADGDTPAAALDALAEALANR